ncbi:hypothetical protein FRC01_010570, partial [Tulasnella sp. 417]
MNYEDTTKRKDSPELRRLLEANPLAQFPTMITPEGGVMTETAAIALYLNDRHGLGSPWSTSNLAAPQLATFYRFLVYIPANIYPTVTIVEFPERYVSVPKDASVTLDEVKKWVSQESSKRRADAWTLLETQLGPGVKGFNGRFLLGTDHPTVLDVYMAMMAHWSPYPRYDWLKENCPRLYEVAAETIKASVVVRQGTCADLQRPAALNSVFGRSRTPPFLTSTTASTFLTTSYFSGDGTQCLGGCNPLHSHSLDSCTPAPLCADETTTFNTLDRVLTNYTMYEGNATTHDWVVDSGKVFISSKNELVLTLTKDNNGTRISSTRYVHYGTITATLKTARSAGVVNAFITMSDVRDEIDWEWPGAKTTEAQSNYFFLGQVDYSDSHGGTHDGLTDTFANFHDYTIDWTPDTLTWSIDGNPVRTLKKEDTLSKDGSYYAYPTTPARVQLSIWPAGIPGAPQGTVDWAGGMIDYNDPDYVAQGQFSTIVKSVTI